MFIECTHPDHVVDAAGRVDCPDPRCLVAAIDRSTTGLAPNPMDRLPRQRPEWILSSSDVLEEGEVEALAILGDAGLIPQIVSPGLDDAASGMRPVGLHRAGEPGVRGA